MSISARKTKHGTVYDVRLRVDNRHVSRTCATLEAAKLLEAELLSDRAALSDPSASMTLAQYIGLHYWPVATKRLAATTLDTYEKEIRLRILPTLGDFKLSTIARADVQAMVNSCATATVAKKAVGTLKTILNEAMADDLLTRNPACAKFAYPAPGRQRDNGLVLSTWPEIHAALDIVDNHGSICVQRIAYTGLLLGLRPEERYALTWSCFDTRSETVTITSARIIASAKFGGVQDKATKTANSRRVIPLHPRFTAWLGGQPQGGGPFIMGENGKAISPSTAQKRWSRFLESTDCPPVTIENMRHSFATAYLASGGQLESLSRILGHANISTTVNRYYRPDVDNLRADLLRVC